jgi:MFS family permease
MLVSRILQPSWKLLVDIHWRQRLTNVLQNIILNAFCLICSLIGTWLADKLGRKSIGLISTALLTVFIFLVGALTKLYGDSENTSGIYATVAMIFLFQGSYSVGLTPLTLLYPPEVMNYTIRSLGIGIYNAIGNALGLMVVWAFPFALDAIGWKTYMINGAWDALQFLFVLFYWVETKGKTLEEIDELLDDEYVNDLPTLEQVAHGAKVLDGIEVPIERQSITTKTKADGIDV